ncbi:MAG TPA: hypothetical protein VF179_28330 [Thermoanaerobaculia bacterium]|nr:hypothetical protein [Thermoanaerobaculia bacterium]
MAAGCASAPSIRFKDGGLEPDSITVEINDNCVGESFSKIWARLPSGSWYRLRTDMGDWSGWREAVDDGLYPNHAYCYEAENYKNGVSRTSGMICALTPAPKIELGLISDSAASCGTLPSNPSPSDLLEHVFISQSLAVKLGIDVAAVQGQGPSPQVRIVIDYPGLSDFTRNNATFTVARVCTNVDTTGPYDWNVWMWNTNKLVPLTAEQLPTALASFRIVAPSRTTWTENGTAEPAVDHFAEPNTAANRFFRENVRNVTDKRVALLVPHGGGIERNTSTQIQPFVDELGASSVGVNVWESVGQWSLGGTHDRWHITASDIHRDGFPGLDRLLNEPDFATGRDFQHAVAFHGFEDSTGSGIILGGLADRDVLCYVANTIRSGDRGDEVGLHIANAGVNGEDIQVVNSRGYAPNPTNLQDLEGGDADNIVNRVSRAGTANVWGGIHLEQSSCLRRQMDCDLDGDGSNDTCSEPDCMHSIVARGVAQALAELLDPSNPANPAGACCANFDQCP